jgi:hypothetical protein
MGKKMRGSKSGEKGVDPEVEHFIRPGGQVVFS